MRFLTYLMLSLSCSLPLAFADRSTNAHNTPTICNNEPEATGTAVAQRKLRRSQDRAVSTDTLGPSFERDLFKRSGVVSYDDNCNNAPPTRSGYGPPDFPTMKSVLQQAYADAVTLASASANIDVASPAFTHYFGGTASDVQATHFKAMMAAVKSDSPQYFNIQFECSGTVSECASGDSVAVTDAAAGTPNTQRKIHICPLFWTAATTEYLLYDQSKGLNPSKPYRSAGQNGWCAKTQDTSRRTCQFFATAGHTILHELTHLDSLAAQAGLAPPDTGNDQGRHGTDDAQTQCELLGARAWLQTYKQNDQQASPDYNAESYAAAATEAYFMNLCGFSEIRPLVAAPFSSSSSSSAEATTTPPPPSPASTTAPPPAYATGTCSFHLQETQDCEGDSKNLFAIVNLKDNNHNDIGDTNTSPATNPIGDPINASDPLSFTSKLPMPLVIVGEHRNDYVQFSYGDLHWTSKTTSGPATCSNGGWDPRDGPVCGSRGGSTLAKKQMDCSFPC